MVPLRKLQLYVLMFLISTKIGYRTDACFGLNIDELLDK